MTRALQCCSVSPSPWATKARRPATSSSASPGWKAMPRSWMRKSPPQRSWLPPTNVIGSVIPRRHFGTVAKLHALRARGVPITFVGGNHDRWGGDFLIHDLGIAFHPGEAELDVAGRRAFVAHGDGLT